jgi:bla regulator protein blaR1
MIPLANHLWQSTLCVAVAALLATTLRRNRAEVRHAIWLAASFKFLIPFSLLIALGEQMSWRASGTVFDLPITVVVDLVGQPFSQISDVSPPARAISRSFAAMLPALLTAVWLVGCLAMFLTWAARWRRVAAMVRNASVVEEGRVLATLRALESQSHRAMPMRPLPLLSSDDSMEPGVFGVLRPVLVWPRSMTGRLSDAQLEAILVHELTHVRRYDNLAATVQMIVQSLFWFHPLVWWLGARLVEERERACDEEVIRRGSAPHVYAEGILKTCEFYVESPLPCVAGVTGADLKKRIEQIMRRDAGAVLSLWRKAMLATAAATAIAGPIVIGALSAPSLRAQSLATSTAGPAFEVVSIKPNRSGNGPNGSRFLPSGQYVANNVTLRMLISNAYGAPLQPLLPGQLAGGPDWIDSARFDVLGKAEAGLPPGPDSPLPAMIRNMLADRFKLVMHTEKRALPIFALVLARQDGQMGAQLVPSAIDCSAGRGRGAPPLAPLQPGERPLCGIRLLRGSLSAGGVTMSQFANALSRFAGRLVVDQTGFGRGFDLDLQWSPEPPPPGVVPDPRFSQPPVDPDGPSLFTAIQEQLGLKLVAQQGQIDVLVVDRAEMPTPDDFESVALPAPPPPPPPPPPGL